MLLGGLMALLLAAPRAAEVEDALRRVQAADRYQTELPGAPAPRPAEAREPQRPRRTERREASSRTDPADMRPVGSAIFWIMVGALGVAAAAWIGREIQTKLRARAAIAAADAAMPAPAAAAPAAPLLPHEELARRGEYAEAIHAILVSVLAAIGRAQSGMQPSWTSREILGLVTLEDAAQRALASLVRAVEVTRFGGAAAGEDDYRLALGWLEALPRRRVA